MVQVRRAQQAPAVALDLLVNRAYLDLQDGQDLMDQWDLVDLQGPSGQTATMVLTDHLVRPVIPVQSVSWDLTAIPVTPALPARRGGRALQEWWALLD